MIPKWMKNPTTRPLKSRLSPWTGSLIASSESAQSKTPTLSFRMSCAHGICGSDGMRINGLCGLACQKLVKDFAGEILIEPLPVFKVIKDLVVEQELFFEKYYSIKPFLITKVHHPRRNEGSLRKNTISLKKPSDVSSAPAAQPVALSIRIEKRKPMSDLPPWSVLLGIWLIQGMKGQKSGWLYWTIRMERGAARPLWKCTEVCPKQIPVTKQIGQIKRRIHESKKG